MFLIRLVICIFSCVLNGWLCYYCITLTDITWTHSKSCLSPGKDLDPRKGLRLGLGLKKKETGTVLRPLPGPELGASGSTYEIVNWRSAFCGQVLVRTMFVFWSQGFDVGPRM